MVLSQRVIRVKDCQAAIETCYAFTHVLKGEYDIEYDEVLESIMITSKDKDFHLLSECAGYARDYHLCCYAAIIEGGRIQLRIL